MMEEAYKALPFLKEKRFLITAEILAATVIFMFALTGGASYENREKIGLSKDVDPIHEVYLPV